MHNASTLAVTLVYEHKIDCLVYKLCKVMVYTKQYFQWLVEKGHIKINFITNFDQFICFGRCASVEDFLCR